MLYDLMEMFIFAIYSEGESMSFLWEIAWVYTTIDYSC